MKRVIFKQIFIGVLFLSFLQGKLAYAQPVPGVFYVVTGNGSSDTSWIFGTYHLINDSYLDELPVVVNAFNHAKATVVEVVMDSAEMSMANSKALLQNKGLTELLDEKFADSLDAYLKADVGQGLLQFQSLKPMAVMLSLSMIHLLKDNQALLKKYSGIPLDAAFVARSRSAAKTVIPLETVTQQMDFLFNSMPDEKQAEMLQQFIRKKQENIQAGNELLKRYFENDLSKIYSSYLASQQLTGDMDFLITDRNRNWMKVLPSIIKKQGTFIAVGALHLAGPAGLVAQLRQAGFKVTAQNMKL